MELGLGLLGLPLLLFPLCLELFRAAAGLMGDPPDLAAVLDAEGNGCPPAVRAGNRFRLGVPQSPGPCLLERNEWIPLVLQTRPPFLSEIFVISLSYRLTIRQPGD